MSTTRNTNLQLWGVTILRLVVGAVFVAHGAQKLLVFGFPGVTGAMAQLGLPLPAASAAAVTAAEFLGGIALVLGLFTRWAAIPLAFTMLVALTVAHLKGGFFLPSGIEYVLTLLAATTALALLGPGHAALDNLVAASRAPTAADRALDIAA
ncbi:MAG: DoxX family protein [Gemmatimonadetes bacterium]|nr:DoxX family protein [Gemmatimonadota bacterium]